MSKKHLVTLVIAALVILTIAVGVTAAQGNGNNGNNGGNGNGNGNPNTNQTTNQNGNGTQDAVPPCDPQGMNAQQNAYRNGGIGFMNPENCQQWNAQQRGNMGRGSGPNGSGFFTGLPPAYEGELPQEVIDMMVAGWLDEQNAYAVYGAVIGQFGETAPFSNIQQAEAQHIAAWEFLFDRYEIALPELPEFAAPEFASLADACQTARDAEVANFGLYDEMLATFEEYPDLYQVALALRNASEFNHLPAFENCAGL